MRRPPIVQRVKDRLYPLTPITRFLEFLIECLPRRWVEVRLSPRRDLAVLGEGEYRSTGELPSFEIGGTIDLARGGWFYLEAALVRHTGEREARVHGRRERTPSEASDFSIPIPSNLRGTIREVVRIPTGTRELFWTPMRAPGYFSQSELLLHRISALEAWLRRAHRVLLTLWQQRRSSTEARAGLSLRTAWDNLQDAYLRTARLQIERYRGQDYPGFIASHDLPTPAEINAIDQRLGAAESRPGFSLVMGISADTDARLLDEALRSVRDQLYDDWDLSVICRGELPPAVDGVLNRHRDEDPRIQRSPSPRSESGESWTGTWVRSMSGDFGAVVKPHDRLARSALFLLGGAILEHPEAKLIYTDHDTIDTDGQRRDPMFKPDWNPDLLLSHDYIGDLCAYERGHLRNLGGYRHDVDEVWRGYDLSLRATQKIDPNQVVHVARVLYHRCRVPASALPPSLQEAGRRVVAQIVTGSGAVVEDGLGPGLYHVCHPIPSPAPLVSIIIPTRDKLEVLRSCVDSIRDRTRYPHWEILIVDNRSQEPSTLGWLREITADHRIQVLNDDREFNYSAINNRAVEHARGRIVVLMNNDAEVIDPEWLTEMVGHALRPQIGAVGAKLLYPNGLVQHAGVVLGIGGVAGHVHRYLGARDPGYANRAIVTQNFSAVTAACLAVRKNVYEEVGGLDAEHFRVAFNDVDFCLKLVRAGYRNLFTPHALLNHHESLSRGHDDTPEKRATFEREYEVMKQRWGRTVDPAYNLNLSLEFEDFSLRQY